MKKTAVFLLMLCLMAASVAAVDYTIEAEDFGGGSGSESGKWCYYDTGGLGCSGGQANAEGIRTIGSFTIPSVTSNPVTYTNYNIEQGTYTIRLDYYDKTTYYNPVIIIKNSTDRYEFVATGNPSTEQLVYLEDITLKTGSYDIIINATTEGSQDGQRIYIDYLLLEQQQSQLPEFGLVGVAVGILVISVAMILHNKKKNP